MRTKQEIQAEYQQVCHLHADLKAQAHLLHERAKVLQAQSDAFFDKMMELNNEFVALQTPPPSAPVETIDSKDLPAQETEMKEA